MKVPKQITEMATSMWAQLAVAGVMMMGRQSASAPISPGEAHSVGQPIQLQAVPFALSSVGLAPGSLFHTARMRNLVIFC